MEELIWYLIFAIFVYAVIGGVISEIKERIDNKRYEQFLKENPEAQELLNDVEE